MGIFNLVTPGAPTLASDLNQYANILNGTTAGGVMVNGSSNAFIP